VTLIQIFGCRGADPLGRRLLGRERAIGGEVREPLGLGLSDCDELVAHRPDVVDQPAPFPPDRLGAAREFAL
jgi:hypothetical protein